MENILIKRLKIIKDTMLIIHLDEVNTDSQKENILGYDFYNTLLDKTFSGEFDDVFLSTNLDNLDIKERDKIFALARKYKSLCFYLGELDNWTDSIEGVSLSDLDLVSAKLLDHYDYLIRLAKNGGEEVLKFLDSFKDNNMFQRGAIIPLLRNSFYSDEVLETILIEMSKEDGKFKDFNNKQKKILCNYPAGVLYTISDDKRIEFADISVLKEKIIKGFMGSYDVDFKENVSSIDSYSFQTIIASIYTDYYEGIYNKYRK